MAIGKIFGAVFGMMLGGALGHPLLGLCLGIYLGSKLDRLLYGGSNRQHHFHFNPFGAFMQGMGTHRGHSPTQQVFFDTTFSVMGHVAKSDGRISTDEIQAAEAVMRQMRMDKATRKSAIEAFHRGKAPGFDLGTTLLNFQHACGHQPFLYQLFIEIQWQAARSGGTLSANKRAILQQVASILGIHAQQSQWSSFAGAGQGHYRGGGSGRRYQGGYDLNGAYQTLGVNESASDDEIKKAYRRLMRENHPDKLMAKGLPEEMIKLANQKVSKIKSAYETIKQHRNFK